MAPSASVPAAQSGTLTQNQKIVIVAGGVIAILLAGGAVVHLTRSKGKGASSAGADHSHTNEAGSHGHTHTRGTGIRPVSSEPLRSYTKEELRQFDGVQNPRILISLKRKVYEVAPQFYGPGADYHVFAGHEASLSLATGDLKGLKLDKYWIACNEEELKTLDHYVDTFESKYPMVGYFVPDDSFYVNSIGE